MAEAVDGAWQTLCAIRAQVPLVHNMTNVVAIFNYLTRLADGLGLQLDAGTREASESGVRLERSGG